MRMAAFSVLLPVYRGDHPAFLDRSIRSVTTDQHLRPNEVVVVRDGPVTPAIEAVLQIWEESSPVPVVVVRLADNVGLGVALTAGLDACSHDVVARQDADDVSLPERFARLVPLIESGVDLAGSGLMEFDTTESHVVGRRTPPTGADEIADYARFHDPFNHPTVAFRRSVVGAVGGYEDLPLLEDYWLFVRMIMSGASVTNIADPLVLYRVGAGSYARRGGVALLRSEVELQRRMHATGFTSRSQYLRNVVMRGGYRLVPEGARRLAYQGLLGHWSAP